MAISATPALAVTLQGDTFIASTILSASALFPANTNAAPPSFFQLSAGNNTIPIPSGFTVNGVVVAAPSGSVNTKIIKGANADTGFTFTVVPCCVPLTNPALVINSVGSETVKLIWF